MTPFRRSPRHALFLGRRKVLALLGAACLPIAATAQEVRIHAPNVVPISARIVTSGQPDRESLQRLAAMGFGAVIYLAPPTVPDAVRGEAEIVRGQGMEFVNIPIDFGEPTDADFRQFVSAMDRLRDRKVLVHCQVNMRASSMTFLYRAVVLKEKPDDAYQDVARVWSPRGPWLRLITAQLKQAGIAFDPY